METNETPVVVATGGPADLAVTHGLGAPIEEPKPAPALYKGLNGEIKTPEELVKYASNLEAILVAKSHTEKPAEPSSFSAPAPYPPPAPKVETFEDVVYTDPKRAEELLLQKFESRQEAKRAAEERQKQFWGNFYQKNPDLKDMDHIVQSVFKRDRAEIGAMPDNDSVARHLVKESRSMVDLVKGTLGVTETRLDSKPAVTVTSQSGPGSAPSAAAPPKFKSFSEQLTSLRRRGKKS